MNPLSTITVKELRPLLRSHKAFGLLLLALVVLGSLLCFFWIVVRMDNVTSALSAQYGRLLFFILSGGALCAFGVISPLITATSITAEREAGTLDLLLSTGLSRPRILLGKLAASLAYQLLLAFCMTPILILPFMLGGIGADEILFCIGLILMTTVTYGMLGLAVSCWMRRSASALFLALFLVFMFAVLIPLAPAILIEISRNRYGPDEEFLFPLSPILTLVRNLNGLPSRAVSPMTFRSCGICQGALFIGFYLLAWRGFARRAAERPVTARRQIDDPAELERRRRRWPYYLIDPQRRPQAIADGCDPLYVKEKRLGALSWPQVFIRLCYLGGLVSVAMTMMLLTRAIPFAELATFLLVPLALLALSQSAFALAREREEKTLDLLRATPLPARAIVRAKFLALMRLILLLTLSLLLIPLIFMALVFLFSLRQQHYWSAISPVELCLQLGKALVFALALTAFYAALGLWCSARSRRGVTAIVAAFVTAGALNLLPFIFEALDRAVMMNANIRYLGGPSSLDWLLDGYRALPHDILISANYHLGPLISPYYYLDRLPVFSGKVRDLFYQLGYPSTNRPILNGCQVLIHALEVSALTWLTLRLAARRLIRAEK